MSDWPIDMLIDAEERHAEDPERFDILPLEERRNLQPGQYAKLAFVNSDAPPGPSAERMWVQIAERRAGGFYLGRLNIEPAFVPLDNGAPVLFEPLHIYDVCDPGEEDTPG
jgi:hypothetical protein